MPTEVRHRDRRDSKAAAAKKKENWVNKDVVVMRGKVHYVTILVSTNILQH